MTQCFAFQIDYSTMLRINQQFEPIPSNRKILSCLFFSEVSASVSRKITPFEREANPIQAHIIKTLLSVADYSCKMCCLMRRMQREWMCALRLKNRSLYVESHSFYKTLEYFRSSDFTKSSCTVIYTCNLLFDTWLYLPMNGQRGFRINATRHDDIISRLTILSTLPI